MHANKQQQQIEMKKYLGLLLFLTPVLNSQGMKKLRYVIIIIIFYTPGNIDPRG